MQTAQKFTYIIIGAGSAGCVLANRLSANKDNQVLLIEAGPADNTPLIKIPMGFGLLVGDKKYAWHYKTKPFGPNKQMEEWSRGRTLGGSSAINGMIYNRGSKADWDGLAAAGNSPDFSWEHILRHYKYIENNQLGPSPTRGTGGPLGITTITNPDPLMEAVVQGGTQVGLKRMQDVNESDEERIGHAMCNIFEGRRVSAAHAFLDPIKERPNLTIVTDTYANRLLFKGDRVIGVEVESGGKISQVFASREVVVSMGSLKTPKLLMLSGIGPVDVLRKAGVAVRFDSPYIGRRLVEHRELILQARLKENLGINKYVNNPLSQAISGAKYLLTHKGVMAYPSYHVMAFFKSRPEEERVDSQMLFAPFTAADYEPGENPTIEKLPGIQVIGTPLRPTSEGYLEITGSKVHDPIVIDANYCATDHDRRILVDVFAKAREIFSTGAIAHHIDHETIPGAEITDPDQLIDKALDRGYSGYHAISTCKMGPNPADAVDEKLRVRGVQGLRVMDCSILPTMVSGNGNGPMMAMASRVAEMMLEEA